MNSNLFPKPLDTSGARTFFGIEALMYQGENFLSALSGAVKKLKEKGKFDTATIKDIDFSGIASRFTKMNVTIQVTNGWAAYMYMPPMDNSHPFQNNYLVNAPLFATGGEMILKGKGDPIAEINYKDATVGGVYSDIPVNIFIGKEFFRNHFTNEEVAAILLHEIGHAFTYFYYLGRMFFANFLISSYAQEIIGTRDVERRKILIKAAERRLGTELYNPNALAEQPTLDKNKMETLFINAHRYTLANTTGTDIYDFRSCEQLADYFATMHGAGPHLISGLNKFYEMSGSDALLPFPIYLIGELFKFIMSPITLPISLLIIAATNPSIKRYDDPAARAKYIEMQMRGTLKDRNLDPEMRKSLLASIEAAGQHSSRLTDHKGLDHLLWTTLSPSYRRGVKQEQSQKILEGILFNDLYHKAAVFDSLEEFSPLVDEAVVALIESREDGVEDDLVGVNTNELNSDVTYLTDVAERAINGDISTETLNNVKSIIKKYKLENQVGLEEYDLTVSNEGLSGLAIGAITIAIAAVIAIIWKIITKLNDSGSAITKASTEINESAANIAQFEATMSNIAQQKPKVKEIVVQSKAAGISTVADVDRAVAASTKPKNTTSSTIASAVSTIANPLTPAPAPAEPTKPKASPLPLLMLTSSPLYSIFGRVIDDDFMRDNLSYRKLYQIHSHMEPSLVKKYGPNGLDSIDDLNTYIDFFFKNSIKGHLHQYLKQSRRHYVNMSINSVEGINKSIDTAITLGAALPNIINKLLEPVKPENIKRYFSKVTKDDKGELRYNGTKATFGNYVRGYFGDNGIKAMFNGLNIDTPDTVEDAILAGNFLGFGSDIILDSPLLNKLERVKIDKPLEVKPINDKMSILTKELERDKEKLITAACDIFEKELSKSDKNSQNFIGYNNKAIASYVNDVISMISRYERDLADLSGWLLFVNKYMNKMIAFYKASAVMYVEYVNTPG